MADRVVNDPRTSEDDVREWMHTSSYLPVTGKRRSCCPRIPGLRGSVSKEHDIPWRLPGQPEQGVRDESFYSRRKARLHITTMPNSNNSNIVIITINKITPLVCEEEVKEGSKEARDTCSLGRVSLLS